MVKMKKYWQKCLKIDESSYDRHKYNLLKAVIDYIKEQSKLSLETKTSDWIPCSEDLPKDSKDVIITTRSDIVGIGYYLGNGSWVQ